MSTQSRNDAIALIKSRTEISIAAHGDWIIVKNERGETALGAKIRGQEYANDHRGWELSISDSDGWVRTNVDGLIRNGLIDADALLQEIAEKVFDGGLGGHVDPSLAAPAADHGHELDFD